MSISISWDLTDSERDSEASVSVLLPFCGSLEGGFRVSVSGSSVVGSGGSMGSAVGIAAAAVVGFDCSSSSSSSSL
ncbi:hypothetical protein EV2_007329 [Malus domestica]